MQAQCLSRDESRKRIKAAATTKPKTFTTEDTAGRKLVVANGTRRVGSVDAVQCEDGTVGKQGLSTTIINVHGQTRLDMQRQELKTNEWDIIRQAKEAGVPGMYEVAAAFVKQHFAYLLDTNKLTKTVYSLFFHSLFMRQSRVCRDANIQSIALPWRMLQLLQCILL
jgi:hypothetical protein